MRRAFATWVTCSVGDLLGGWLREAGQQQVAMFLGTAADRQDAYTRRCGGAE
ncbi:MULTISPECIES: hypothetical protein [Streptomyces]|uniref:ADP-ribosylglycohydrolase family protein n=1 Tax=Streptomyces siderophoricus TaxID=2802281 RepID=A0ABS1MJA6_9ACTN|nr:hypothetical protein [Streptomyces sp. 9-7]MBL1088067.1 hypothetical protein [Streptomyces sp. 9-7]